MFLRLILFSLLLTQCRMYTEDSSDSLPTTNDNNNLYWFPLSTKLIKAKTKYSLITDDKNDVYIFFQPSLKDIVKYAKFDIKQNSWETSGIPEIYANNTFIDAWTTQFKNNQLCLGITFNNNELPGTFFFVFKKESSTWRQIANNFEPQHNTFLTNLQINIFSPTEAIISYIRQEYNITFFRYNPQAIGNFDEGILGLRAKSGDGYKYILSLYNNQYITLLIQNLELIMFDEEFEILASYPEKFDKPDSVKFFRHPYQANIILMTYERIDGTSVIVEINIETQTFTTLKDNINGRNLNIAVNKKGTYFIGLIKQNKVMVLSTEDFTNFATVGNGFVSLTKTDDLQISLADDNVVVAFLDKDNFVNAFITKKKSEQKPKKLEDSLIKPKAIINLGPPKIAMNTDFTIYGSASQGLNLNYTWKFDRPENITIKYPPDSDIVLSGQRIGTVNVQLEVEDLFGNKSVAAKFFTIFGGFSDFIPPNKICRSYSVSLDTLHTNPLYHLFDPTATSYNLTAYINNISKYTTEIKRNLNLVSIPFLPQFYDYFMIYDQTNTIKFVITDNKNTTATSTYTEIIHPGDFATNEEKNSIEIFKSLEALKWTITQKK